MQLKHFNHYTKYQLFSEINSPCMTNNNQYVILIDFLKNINAIILEMSP